MGFQAEDAAYFVARAARERQLAEQATDRSVRDIHRQLATLYAAKAAQPAPAAQLATG